MVFFSMVLLILMVSSLDMVHSGSFVVYSNWSFMVHGYGDVVDGLLMNNMFPTVMTLRNCVMSLGNFMMTLGDSLITVGNVLMTLCNFMMSLGNLVMTLGVTVMSMGTLLSVGDVDGLGGVSVAVFVTMMVLSEHRCYG